MPNTIQTSINFVQAALGFWIPTIGTGNEPALSAANLTQQVMTSPPFRFPWNRNTASFQTTQFVQDYTVNVTDFGFLETGTFQPSAGITNVAGSGTTATMIAANSFKPGALVTITGLTNVAFNVTNQPILTASATQFTFASATSLASTPDAGLALSGRIGPLNIKNTTPLGESSDSQQPITIAVQLNTVGTSIKVRLLGTPNARYNIVLWYQKFAPLLSALTGSTGQWIAPDYFSYVYNRGFLAHLYEARGDVRAQQEKIAFAAALLATTEGLTDTEVNIFLAQYLANPRAMES